MVTYRIDKLNTHLRGQGDVGWATSDAMLPIKHKMLCLFLPHHPNSPFPPRPGLPLLQPLRTRTSQSPAPQFSPLQCLDSWSYNFPMIPVRPWVFVSCLGSVSRAPRSMRAET